MLTPRVVPILVFLCAATQGMFALNWQDSAQGSGPFLWRPTIGDRQACKLGEKVTVSPVTRASYKNGTDSYQLSVFKAEFPDSRLVFAASVFDRDKPGATQPEVGCVWNLDYSQYLRSSELQLGPARHAVRIDVESLTGEVQVAMIVGEVNGKVKRLLVFRPSEICPPDLAPGWNYMRTMTVLPSDKNTPFYDVRIETKSWCTRKGNTNCIPETGPQNLTTSEVFTFRNDTYGPR